MGEEIDVKRLKRQRQGHINVCEENVREGRCFVSCFKEENRGKVKALRDVLNEKLGVLSDVDSSILSYIDD
jgi:hypothetical protein